MCSSLKTGGLNFVCFSFSNTKRLPRAVGYVGAATVEYHCSMQTGEDYFLELNPRLQVCCLETLFEQLTCWKSFKMLNVLYSGWASCHWVDSWSKSSCTAQVAVRMGIPLWLHFLVILISNCFLMYRSDASMEWTTDEAMTSAGKLQLLLHHLSLMK